MKRRRFAFLRPVVVLVLLVALPAALRTGCGSRRSLPDPLDWRDELARRLSIRPRADWEAAPPLGEAAPLGAPARITVHHTGGAKYTTTAPERIVRSLRAIQKDHQTARRWLDIGYHYVIDPGGRVWEGRSSLNVGAHAGSPSLNERNVGILVLGNFDLQEPSVPQLASLDRLLGSLLELCSIPASEVYTHNEVRTGGGLDGTACPGRHLARYVAGWRS